MAMAGDVASGLRYNPDMRTYIVFDESGSYVIDTPFSETAIHWWRLHHPEADGPDIEPVVVRHRGSCSECPGCAVLRQATSPELARPASMLQPVTFGDDDGPVRRVPMRPVDEAEDIW